MHRPALGPTPNVVKFGFKHEILFKIMSLKVKSQRKRQHSAAVERVIQTNTHTCTQSE